MMASVVRHEEKVSSDLHVYQYLVNGNNPVLEWDIQDFGGNLCDVVLVEESIQMLDLNSDGFKEVSFLYQQRCDGLDPYVTKQMVISKSKKYAVRGKLAVEDGAQLEKNFDPAFDGASPAFRSFANMEWDEFVQNGSPASTKALYEEGHGWAILAHKDLLTSGGTTFSLLDQTGKLPPMPEKVRSALTTAADVNVIPGQDAMLILSLAQGALVYEPKTGTATSLLTFLGDTEALSTLAWSPSSKQVAFSALNQAQYPEKTKIFVLKLDGLKLISKEKYDAPVMYMAASNWVVYPVEFEGEQALKYEQKARDGEEAEIHTLKLK